MARFVVAFRDRDTGEKFAALLRESGHEVHRICTSAGEVRRAFRMINDGILISGYRLSDQFLDQLAMDLGDHVEILCLAKPDQIASLSSPKIFRCAIPVTKQVFAAWVEMMTQLHYQNLPQRSETEKETVDAAKKLVMESMDMSEAEAHRYLQQLSMRLGLRMIQVAERIIRHENV